MISTFLELIEEQQTSYFVIIKGQSEATRNVLADDIKLVYDRGIFCLTIIYRDKFKFIEVLGTAERQSLSGFIGLNFI